jgi:hypothetical protein
VRPPSRAIQPIHSEDQIHTPARLFLMKNNMYDGTDNIKYNTISKHDDKSSEYGDLASIADSYPDASSVDESIHGHKVNSMAIKMKQREFDANEIPMQENHNILARRVVENQSSPNSVRTKATLEDHLIDYEDDTLQLGDSSTTLTGRDGNDYDDEDEDEEQQLFDVNDKEMADITRHLTAMNKHGFPFDDPESKNSPLIQSTKQKEYY